MAKVLSTGSGWIWIDSADPGVSETNVFQGNFWLNTSTNALFNCKDPTIDTQVWEQYFVGTPFTSFTPTVAGSVAAGSATYSTQVGRYVKVGPLVSCWINLVWSDTDGSGNMLITGLPFSVNAALTPTCTFVCANILLPVGGLMILGQLSGQQIDLVSPITSAALAPVVLSSAGTLQTSFQYAV